jgi:hypothetical protein
MPDGPYYFAWVNASDFVWDEYGLFARKDEQIVNYEVSQTEGEFASLSIDIRNPKIGLLSGTRKIWAWLSIDLNWAPGANNTPNIVPLFFGRLTGIPTNINQEIVTLELTARPADYVAQKAAFAETLKVAPYDPIWINPANLTDPDTVLEFRAAAWSIDRVTHEIGISDILSGEDGVAAFLPSEVPYDQVKIALVQAPLSSVSFVADIPWTQRDSNVIDFGSRTFETYTGSSTIQNWLKSGTSLQGGWSVEVGTVTDVWDVEEAFSASYETSWQSIEPKHAPGDTISTSLSSTVPVLQGPGTPYLSTVLTEETHSGVGSAKASQTSMFVLKHLLTTDLKLRYDAARSRTERIKFTLRSNIQPVVVDGGEEATEVINISAVDVGMPLPNDEIPIVDVARGSFITTARGILALESLISMGRARLLQSARCINITFPIKFERAIQLSCRMNASLTDDRLPGGFAIGKIVAYSFKCDGETGDQTGSVTIACAIGYGGFVSAVQGDPEYCETDYVENDYQQFANSISIIPGGDVGYTLPVMGVVDDGFIFPLTKDQVTVRDVWHGSLQDQEDTINDAFPVEVLVANQAAPLTLDQLHANQALTSRTVSEVMKDHAIWRDIEIVPVNGTFVIEFNIGTTPLEVPQMLNLEAA